MQVPRQLLDSVVVVVLKKCQSTAVPGGEVTPLTPGGALRTCELNSLVPG